jgi:trk system potassium uptake protein TrkH
MIDFRPVLFVLGILLSILAVAMLLPAAVDGIFGNPDWQVFLASAGVTLFVGVSMMLTTRSGWGRIGIRQGFLMATLAWVVISVFGALPLAFSELNLSFTDALFESMSGITTTGATVITGLDTAPPGILFWRAILQWLGGIGIIVMAISILPMLQIGGMQMFKIEAFETDKVLPRAAQLAGGIAIVYVLLTFMATITLWALGMNGFDAVAHAMTSIATGGLSTRDASIGYFPNPEIQWAVCIFMVLGATPFVLYLRALRGNVMALFRDTQVQWMLAIMAISVAAMTAHLVYNDHLQGHDAIRHAAFNVISVMTGTGYSSVDYGQWGEFAFALLFVLMFIGGCAGSTSCGIKIFRIQVLYETALAQLRRLIQPNGVFIPYYNHRPIPETVAFSVMSFFFLFITAFGLLAAALGMVGLDFITAVSGAASALANVGPGLGDIIGPAGNYQSLPDMAKWLLAAGMLLGRLELFTVLVLFAPAFWRG